VVLPETKNQQEEYLRKHAGSIYAKKHTNRKSNDEEGGDKQTKARLIIDNEKQDPFQLMGI